ncbi:MAG: hypothetical protein H9W81_07725 [Enterococcus sp.]|nr:hypothetical protein [Enterococcus sp.]
MNKLKNLGLVLVTFAALLATPTALAPATVASADEKATSVSYSELTFSASGGADLK